MGRWSNDAAVRDAQMERGMEECASIMGQQSKNEKDVAVLDARRFLKKEEYV